MCGDILIALGMAYRGTAATQHTHNGLVLVIVASRVRATRVSIADVNVDDTSCMFRQPRT